MESLSEQDLEFEDVCVIRHDAIPIMREQLLHRRVQDIDTNGVVFTSPLVDCAATMKFALQTAEADRLLLELTGKDIRHLSKGRQLWNYLGGDPGEVPPAVDIWLFHWNPR